jgi:hypothetical protein
VTKAEQRGKPTIKTTLRLSQDLWRQARVRALDERTTFQDIVERALTEYLKDLPKKRGGPR